jgi:hypothetical protein
MNMNGRRIIILLVILLLLGGSLYFNHLRYHPTYHAPEKPHVKQTAKPAAVHGSSGTTTGTPSISPEVAADGWDQITVSDLQVEPFSVEAGAQDDQPTDDGPTGFLEREEGATAAHEIQPPGGMNYQPQAESADGAEHGWISYGPAGSYLYSPGIDEPYAWTQSTPEICRKTMPTVVSIPDDAETAELLSGAIAVILAVSRLGHRIGFKLANLSRK